MINSIINSMAQNINVKFSNKYKIYTEKVVQGVKTPCFFIALKRPNKNHVLNNRHLAIMEMKVTFLPQEKNAREQMNEIYLELNECLESIKVCVNGELINLTARNISTEIEDDVLYLYITYSFFIEEVKTTYFQGNVKSETLISKKKKA